MPPFLLRVLTFLVIATATGVAFQGQTPSRPWPPPLQPASETTSAPVLSPADEMKTFHLPPGYRVELVASEPLISDPVVMDFDAAGRMWLVEMPGYMSDVRASDELEPTGRVVVLDF